MILFCRFDRGTSFLALGFLSFLMFSEAQAQSVNDLIAPDSAMAKANLQWQRLLLSAFESDSPITKAAVGISELGVDPAPPEAGAKCGSTALALHGTALVKGCKGDFSICGPIPGQCKFLGLWLYRMETSNVDSVGFQIVDAEGECLLGSIPADWNGWKWVELDLEKAHFEQAYPQTGKNGKIDFPLKSFNLTWRTQAQGATSLVADGLVAITEMSGERAGPVLRGQVVGGTTTEFGQKFSAQYVLTNYSDRPIKATIDFSLQTDPTLSASTPPDPVLGSDEALGKKSWTECEGKVMEEGSLTDGKDFTEYKSPRRPGYYSEMDQYIDLGTEKNVIAMKECGGDVNWIWKLDVAASADGKGYTPVADLQGVDFHGKWGANLPFPVKTPFKARFLRFRYYTDGPKVDALSTFNGISVYDGIADEKLEVPVVGKMELAKTLTQEVPAHAFAVVGFNSPQPLQPGSYALYALTQEGNNRCMDMGHAFVFPEVLKEVNKDSRFGLNASETKYAPILRRLGVGWIRFENMKWPFFSAAPDSYDFTGGVKPWEVNGDDVLKTYTSQGMSVIPMMFMTPKYASSADASVSEDRVLSYPPKDNAQAAGFYYQTAARYASKAHPPSDLQTEDKKSGLNLMNIYEIWNEENLNAPAWGTFVGSMDQYYDMMRPCAEAIKKADPSATVLNGGFSGTDVKVVDGLRTHKYADGKCPLDFIDVLNVHFYSGRVSPELVSVDQNTNRSAMGEERTLEGGLKDLVAWRDANKKGIPIWMTETGYDSAGPFGTTERLEAARLPRVIMIMLANGVEKVIVYREKGSTPAMHSASGVLRDDDSLKPSFFTYGTLIRQMQKAVPVKRLFYPDPNIWIYSWKRGDETFLTAWSVDGPATLDLKIGKCLVTDAFGHQDEKDISGNFKLADYPVYISNIADYNAVVASLDQKEREFNAAKQAENDRLAKLKAYLFDFGTSTGDQTLVIGKPRPFIPISKDTLIHGGVDYGFAAPAMDDEIESDRRDTISQTLSRIGAGTFTFKAAPGMYHLRLNVTPFGNAPLNVTITGGTEAIKKQPTEDNDVIETDIEIKDASVTIAFDNFARLRWLTLIEKDAKWEASQKIPN